MSLAIEAGSQQSLGDHWVECFLRKPGSSGSGRLAGAEVTETTSQ